MRVREPIRNMYGAGFSVELLFINPQVRLLVLCLKPYQPSCALVASLLVSGLLSQFLEVVKAALSTHRCTTDGPVIACVGTLPVLR